MSTAALPLAPSFPRTSSAFWREVGLVVAVALVFRLAWSLVIVGGAPMHGDAADYFRDAQSLLAEDGRSRAFYWPPGTAYVLSSVFRVFGPSETAARVTMAIVSALTAGLIGWFAKGLTNSRLTGLVAAGLWAIYPPALLYADQSGSQHLSAFCLAGGLLYAARCLHLPNARNIALCGLLLGLGCLTRPSMLSIVLLLPVMAAWLWWDRRRRGRELVPCEGRTGHVPFHALLWLGAIFAAVVVPTALHNARTGAGWTLSTNNERNFFIGNNPYAPWYKTSHLAQRSLDEHPAEIQEYLKRHYDQPNPRQAMKQAAMAHIRERPDLFVLRTFNRACAFWGFDYLASRTLQQTMHVRTPVFLAALALEAGGYILVMLLGLYGLTRWRQFDPHVRVWLIAGTLAYAAPYLIAFSAGTYHYPVLALVIPFAAAALVDGERIVFPWAAFRSKAWLAMTVVFLAIQAEYLYFAVRFAG